jgi:hypothetical protein
VKHEVIATEDYDEIEVEVVEYYEEAEVFIDSDDDTSLGPSSFFTGSDYDTKLKRDFETEETKSSNSEPEPSVEPRQEGEVPEEIEDMAPRTVRETLQINNRCIYS